MDSRKVFFNDAHGFTLIEVIVVVAIVGIIAALIPFLNFGVYGRNSFDADRDILVSIMQRARARAINNIEESRHGVYVAPGAWTLFQGDSFASRDISEVEVIQTNPRLSYSGLTEVVFDELTARTNTPGNITITDGIRTETISINYEGGISW